MWINDRIPGAALLFLVPMAIVEPPASAIGAAGGGGFLAFLGGFGLAVLGALAAAALARRQHGDTLIGSLRALFGRPVGTGLAASYALFWTATAAWLLRYEAAKTIDILLPLTPLEVPMLCILAVGVYLAANGVEPLARWSVVVLPFGLSLALLFALLGIARGETGRLLEPPPGGLAELARGSWEVAGMLEGIATPLALLGYLIAPRRIVAATLGGMAIGGLGLGSTVAMAIAILGVKGAALYHWPAVAAVQNVTMPGFAVEKIDIIYLVGIGMLGMGRFALLYLMACLTIRDLFPSLSVRATALATAGPVMALALLPPHFDTVVRIRSLLAYPTWVLCYAVPLAGLGLSLLRGSGRAAGGACQGGFGPPAGAGARRGGQ